MSIFHYFEILVPGAQKSKVGEKCKGSIFAIYSERGKWKPNTMCSAYRSDPIFHF